MACPCFEPTDPLPWGAWPGRYRPPLGRPYAGICRSEPDERYEPTKDLLVGACNLGYARRRCDRVPETAPDAVRFSLAEADAVRWAIEREHMPVDCGTARKDGQSGRGPLLDMQIAAYRRSCHEQGEPLP